MVTTKVRQLQGFVSAPAGTDLSQLIEVLEENNIHILDPARFAPGAVKTIDKIIDGVRHADLVVAVLGSAHSSANVLFELGCASALGNKALVIVPEEYEIPSDIKDLVYIRATPNNREAVSFALEQIIDAPEQEIKHKARLLDSSKPLGGLAIDLLNRLESFDEDPSERDVEDIVREMLEASGIATRIQQKYREIRPDFAVWIDELEPYFGNPILIKVKGRLHTARQAKYVVEQVLHYISVSNAITMIIFAAQISSDAMEVVSSYPNLYFFDLHDFLKRLHQESLGQIIRNEHNARVHGILR
ncbi:MAG: nucleotide-binding protein [Cyanothece sp. SIO1E1]|nr:nucleotide-binding protein [Cyanothece sp. SIO1E1]